MLIFMGGKPIFSILNHISMQKYVGIAILTPKMSSYVSVFGLLGKYAQPTG